MTDQTSTDRWWALVGPALFLEPSGFLTTPHDRFRVLSQTYDLGKLRLEPGDRSRSSLRRSFRIHQSVRVVNVASGE